MPLSNTRPAQRDNASEKVRALRAGSFPLSPPVSSTVPR